MRPMLPRFCFVLAVAFSLLQPAPCVAQASHKDTTLPEEAFQPKVKPSLQIEAKRGGITIDGELGDPGWQNAARATGFAEIRPGDEVQPPVKTDTYLAYDDHHLYVAFRAHDDPEAVRASLRNRDKIFQDDWVGIVLDTYGDAQRAYELFANPLGIQGDLLMTQQGEDSGFDMLYRSEGRLTDDGYQVEMAIPFSSLRFPDEPVQTWRITFLRNHPRTSRHLYSWATVSRDDPCLPCQLGTLRGLRGLQADSKLDVLPALVGSQAGSLADADDPGSNFDNDPVHFEPSLNLRYDLTSSLAAEATINPDFSQVASDAAQIDVNTTFALSFPERRPFFQEGSELLDSYIDLVYTRSINDPIAAAKATRRGKTSLVYLSAVDENAPLLLPFEERSDVARVGRSASNVLRVRRSFGENSFVGGVMSDRRFFAGGSGTETAMDLGYQFHKNYRVEGQLALSRTSEPSDVAVSDSFAFRDGRYTSALDGERFWGHGSYLTVERNAETWDFDLTYRGYSPTFRTANGFVQKNNFRSFRMGHDLDFYSESNWVEVINPGLVLRRDINFEGERKEDLIEPWLFARLTGQTQIYGEYEFRRERFRGFDFGGLRAWYAELNSQFSEPLSVGFYVNGGRAIYRSGTIEEERPITGKKLSAGVQATIKPLQRFVIEPQIDYAWLRDPETEENFYSGYIARMQTSLQLTRELSLRLITQYDDFSDQLNIEPLLSYELNPYSVFYVGSKMDYGAYDEPFGLTAAERQFFFKFQYLFRM